MSLEIYYFSGTGNSLAVARDIAAKTGAKIIPIPSVVNHEIIEIGAGAVGIVFPVYNQGVPYIVKRFVARLRHIEGTYVFAVCTHGGGPGIALRYLDRMVAASGGKLSAGFAVQMPYNYVTPSLVLKDFYHSFKLRENSHEKQQKLFKAWHEKLDAICGIIAARTKVEIETKSAFIEQMVDRLNLRETAQKAVWLKIAGFKGKTDLPFTESIQLLDHGFSSSEACTGCGICKRVCPVENIDMRSGRPVWLHRCEQCFACLHWCPKQAILFGRGTSGRTRYHHPDVKLADMLS